MRHQAIYEVYPDCTGIVDGVGVYGVDDKLIEVDENLIQSKIAELEAAEPMRLLRQERNRRLSEADWVVIRAYSQKQDVSEDWANYMQALRDLPKMIEPDDSTEPLPAPTINEQGQLIFLHWPEVPK